MKLRITSIPNLITFLKRLKAVDRSVILELTQEKLFSKVHTPDKSVMKYSSVPMSDVLEGEVNWKSLKNSRIKIGITDVTRLMEAFKHFRPEEDVFIDLSVESVDDQSVATEVKLNSSSLNIRLRCADLSLLSYVEDNILEMVHSKNEALVTFKLYQSDFSTIISLCGLETNSEEILVFEASKKTVHAKGDSFRYKLNLGPSEIELYEGENSSANIYKNQLSFMEPETCSMYFHQNRLVLISEQSSTSIAIGLVEK